MDMQPAIDKVYSNRKDFLIIGLTGRIGSGCTTASNILCKDPRDLPLVVPDDPIYDKRHYEILFEYYRENWKPLEPIRFSDVISTFLLETNMRELIEELVRLCPDGQPNERLNERFWTKLKYQELQGETKTVVGKLSDEGIRQMTPNEASAIVDYFRTRVRRFTDALRESIIKVDPKLYIQVYQTLGDNVRKYGVACGQKGRQPASANLYALAERVKWILKCFRRNDISRFVIDAFRNPFEALYFSERYNAFYLIALKCSKEDREDRLLKKNGLTVDEIRAQDAKESPDHTYENINQLVSQNIPVCLEKSDIHIDNCGAWGQEDRTHLIAQLVRYVSLIGHPGLVTPTDDERFMQIAYAAKANSGCISRQVGAVALGQGGSICGIGWNDVPCGQVSCSARSVTKAMNHSDRIAYSELEHNDAAFREHLQSYYKEKHPVPGGRALAYCFKDVYNSIRNGSNQIHTRALHAEENAFLQISKHGGVGVNGGTLYSTASPCELCAKKSYQLGIKRIVYIDPYPGISESHVLGSGQNQLKPDPFFGAIGKAYHKLYDPLLPYKDELEAVVGTNGLKLNVGKLVEENSALREENARLQEQCRLRRSPKSKQPSGLPVPVDDTAARN